MPKKKVRFAFTVAEGPNQGLTSGGWRVWANKEDTYIAPAGMGSIWKGSLHGDDAWRWAVTQEHLSSGAEPVWTEPDRAPWKFTPTPFVDGRRLAFVICTMRHALRDLPIDPRDIQVPVQDRWDTGTLAMVWMAEPGESIPDDPSMVGYPLELVSGRRVWVTVAIEKLPYDTEQEPGAISSAILISPDEDRAPGLTHVGVFLDGS